MLTKIVIEGPASFKKRATLETDKKINLVYGLNGTGKSTICRLLREPTNPEYGKCQIEGEGETKIFVFNDAFIQENFYESDDIKGIFSLSKENKDAEEKITTATTQRDDLLRKKQQTHLESQAKIDQVQKQISGVVDKIFEIKRDHSGGDRVLEFCLEGVMGKKEKLLERLLQTSKPDQQPEDTIQQLQDEARLLAKGATQQKEPSVPQFTLNLAAYEADQILAKAIVGSHNSNFADFINELRISDWVRTGAEFLKLDDEHPLICPFCQQKTVDEHVLTEIKAYFDKTFEDQLTALIDLSHLYAEQVSLLPSIEVYERSIFYDQRLGALHGKLQAELDANLGMIREKLKSPSLQVTLNKTGQVIDEINKVIARMNESVSDHNKKIANIANAKKELSHRFWSLMRWNYDQSVDFHANLQAQLAELGGAADEETKEIDTNLKALAAAIAEAQRQTVNVDEAITKINSELVNIGVLEFKIKKHSDHLYRLERNGSGSSSFKSLSEGEKMIIALLYFCELCIGKGSPEEVASQRIAVLDDPISSMSHIFVFNVGRLLFSRLFNEALVAQVFVFTHSLYFFYELTDPNHDRREKTQSLFRVTKNIGGSTISQMKYEEIQNDYQAYWQVINDSSQHPALIANCMRNVIEYFYGFVEKRDFNNVFQKPELQSNKFQAFGRYMNRESHSFGQNVFDIKEFDYQVFREGLQLVFETSGYLKHYKQMAKL